MTAAERRVQAIAWGGLILLAGYLLLRPQPRRDRTLKDVSRTLTPAPDWQRDYAGYFRYGSSGILLTRTAAPGLLWRLDTRTSRVSPLSRLNARLAATPPNVGSWRLSPDGAWLLARDRTRRDLVSAYSVDGNRKLDWHAAPDSMPDMHWLRGGNSWLELRNELQARRRPLFGDPDGLQGGFRTIGRERPVIHREGKPDILLEVLPDLLSWVVGVTPQGRMVDVISHAGGAIVRLVPLQRTAGTVISRDVSLRPNTHVIEAEPDPRGERIAFFADFTVQPSPGARLNQWLHHQKDEGLRRGLWICNLSSGWTHLIGVDQTAAAAGLQWSPDGQRLSYFLGTNLCETDAADQHAW